MPSSTTNLSVKQLENLLERKRTQLKRLTRQRAKLERELEQVNSQIRALEGGGPHQQSRQRPRNEKPLITVAEEVLSRSKNGLPLNQLSEKVLATGYKSNSSNFKNVLYQALYNSEEIVRDAETGSYRRKPR